MLAEPERCKFELRFSPKIMYDDLEKWSIRELKEENTFTKSIKKI
jgi:hypothetical protein